MKRKIDEKVFEQKISYNYLLGKVTELILPIKILKSIAIIVIFFEVIIVKTTLSK